MKSQGEKLPITVLVAYYATVAAFFIASFYPEYRVWGINWWAYFPLWVKFLLLAIGIAAPTVIDKVIDRILRDRDDISPTTYRWLTGGFIVVMLASFYFLRARTHFLGDGYALLGQLETDKFLIKAYEFLATKPQQLIYGFLGNSGEQSALLAYQMVSYVCGGLFLLLSVWAASTIAKRRLDRTLTLVFLGTIGATLLFFGYVENYALYLVAVMLIATLSVHIVKNDSPTWPIIIAAAFAFFCHILAVALIPGIVFILLRRTKPADWLLGQTKLTKTALVAGIIAAFTCLVVYAYNNWVFFRLAFLPIFRNQLTVDGYTLFSANHLIDFANLLLALCPALVVILVRRFAIRSAPNQIDRAVSLAMWVYVTPSLILVYLLDPKLGMPRDWDLFSFVGIPLSLLMTAMIVHTNSKSHTPRLLGLAAVLGALLLLPRAVALSEFSIAAAHAEQYAALDKNRSGPLRFTLTNLYEKRGDAATVSRLKSQWQPDLMANQLEVQAAELMNANRREEALPLLRQLVQIRPNTYGAWQHLGEYFFFAEQYDSSLYYMKIAEGINPYNRDILCNTGVLLFYMRRLDEAEKYFDRATQIDSTFDKPLIGLASIYSERKDWLRYEQFLVRVTNRRTAPPELWSQLIGYYVRMERIADAQETLDRARQSGLDQIAITQILRKYPTLK